MALSAEELFRSVRMSFGDEMTMTAGNRSAERPVLRIRIVEERASADQIRKYDAVIFYEGNRKSCSILDVAETVSRKGAGALIIFSDRYRAYELDMLRRLCDSVSLPLMELKSAVHFSAFVDLIYEKMIGAKETAVGVSHMLEGVIAMPEIYCFYDDILNDHGFFDHSEYYVAVCIFESKAATRDYQSDMSFFAGCVEAGLSENGLVAAVFPAGNQLTAVFADADPDGAIHALLRGLSEIPDALRANYNVYIGSSDLARGIRSLSALMGMAAKTALLQMRRGNEGALVRCSEQHLNKFMVSLNDRDTISSLLNDTLLRLVQYDRQNDTDYIHFLRVYFRNNCSLQKTANELFIHRNSVCYALRKIESIIGRSISDIHTKAELILGLGFLELSGDESFDRL